MKNINQSPGLSSRLTTISRIVPVIIVLLAILAGDGNAQPVNPGKAKRNPPSSARLGVLAGQFIKQSLLLSPVSASAAGYHLYRPGDAGKDLSGFSNEQSRGAAAHALRGDGSIALDGELDEVSAPAVARQRELLVACKKRFNAETPAGSLGLQDRIDLRMIEDQIELSLLETDQIQSYRHNPTLYVELIGNALFLPLTVEYAPPAVRLGHVLSRVAKIPRLLQQARQVLQDSDAIFIKVALDENQGNADLIEHMLQDQISGHAELQAEYQKVAPGALAALADFSRFMTDDLGKRPATRTWRLGKPFYDQKFKLVMQTEITPEQLLAQAESEMTKVRAEMLVLALPLHAAMFPGHGAHANLEGRARENVVIGEALDKIAAEHPRRDQLIDYVKGDVARITQFIRDKKIVSLGPRDNLKVIPTPGFMRGVYSVGGFHGAPPLDPSTEAQYWVTPIDPKTEAAKAESRLREYNNWSLKWLTIHEALPGHYVQFEHANGIQPEWRRLVRNLFANGAYVEGWAEYIAQVMMDAGFLDNDPRYRLSQRKLRLRVISNSILDIRMHTMGMSDAEAMDLMTNAAFQTQAEAEGKLQRAKLSSVQLPTYYVGLREWFDLREKYEKAAGKNFNMREFHDRALDQGAVPVPLLEKILLPGGR